MYCKREIKRKLRVCNCKFYVVLCVCMLVWLCMENLPLFFYGCVYTHSTMDFLHGEGDLLLKGKLTLDIGYGAENPLTHNDGRYVMHH